MIIKVGKKFLQSGAIRHSSTTPLQYTKSRKGIPIAYRYSPGNSNQPGVIFCPGFFSPMEGQKATALEEWCQDQKYSFLRFDYSCIGESHGDFYKLEMVDWRDDLLTLIDNVAVNKKQVLVGSSMGGWMMLHAAIARSDRVTGLVGICVAIDFVQKYYEKLPEDIKKKHRETQTIDTEYGEFVVTSKFLDSAQNLNLLSKAVNKIDVRCPVRLIHGMLDEDVPYISSVTLANKLTSNDIDIILRKTGDHRMSDAIHIDLIINTLYKLLLQIENV